MKPYNPHPLTTSVIKILLCMNPVYATNLREKSPKYIIVSIPIYTGYIKFDVIINYPKTILNLLDSTKVNKKF